MTSEKKSQSGQQYMPRLEKALTASGLTRTAFGYTHFGDPGALSRIEKSNRLYQPTVEKIEKALALFSV